MHTKILSFVLAATVSAALLLGLTSGDVKADTRALAECIGDSGATLYGAHWCPYCKKQKEVFGDSARLLPYVECYEPGTRRKRDACDGVTSYPTWVLEGGVVLKGVQQPETLADLLDCDL